MTGTAKVKTPKDDAEWARNTQRRLEQVEHPSSTRVGEWVLATDPETGNLIASHVNGGGVVIAVPPAGEGDADVVTADTGSYLKLERRANQSMPANTYTAFTWDTLVHKTTDFAAEAGVSSVAIPQDGMWLVHYSASKADEYQGRFAAVLDVNGVTQMVARSPMMPEGEEMEPTLLVSDVLMLPAGAEITCRVWTSRTSNFGPSVLNNTVASYLTLTRFPIG